MPDTTTVAGPVPDWRTVDPGTLTGRALDCAVAGAMGESYYPVISAKDAWPVVEECRKRRFDIRFDMQYGTWVVCIRCSYFAQEVEAVDPSGPIALCRAFVAARQAEEREKGRTE